MNVSGPCPAPIALVGEAWGKNEEAHPEHLPFIGASGFELDRMLAESGIARGDCFSANVCNGRPPGDRIEALFFNKTQAKKLGCVGVLGRYPNDLVLLGLDNLRTNLDRCQPRIIIALGNTALWALTGHLGITKWRGSELDDRTEFCPEGAIILPTIHPAAVLREWPWRSIVIQDFRRARKLLESGIRKPPWQFCIRPSFAEAQAQLGHALEHRRGGGAIACDTETRGGQISCVGIATSETEAFCIPLLSIDKPEGYWSASEELDIIFQLRSCLAADGGVIVFQNGAYDLQYFAKQLGWMPALTDDTMLMQHVLFPGLRKGLDFISSLYCGYHRYWKDDGKLWDPRIHGEEQHWRYNCEDCVRTLECYRVLKGTLKDMGREAQYAFQMRLLKAAVKMMLRGGRVDADAKNTMGKALNSYMDSTESWISTALGRDFNCRSNPQMVSLFYDEMGCTPVKKRTPDGWRVTCDDAALAKIAAREPILRPLIEKIEEFRSIAIFKKNYVEMPLAPDGRMRCTFNLAGTVTFRFSSSEDAFGYGGNLQTLPKGTEE